MTCIYEADVPCPSGIITTCFVKRGNLIIDLEQFPEDQFFFIMGADSLDYFDKWRHPEIICQNATVLAAVRDTLELPQIEGKIRRIKALFPAEIYPLAGGRTDVSSTAIRAQIRMTGECPAMLPGEVWELIKRYHLYGVSNLGE